ncbi:MAG TPA: molybdopterin-dependent oxidoreductase [Planctomycetota bacterium]|nr:molybdopterin-dependent oxidoreductase [Planctomycetota bacterium]
MDRERLNLSRRGFLKGAALLGAAASGSVLGPHRAEADGDGNYPTTDHPSPGYDFTKGSGALQADKVIDSACQFCNSLCRLKVKVKNGRVLDVLGEPEDPVQAGGLCVKGPMMTQLVYNRLRLTRPMKRVAGEKGSPASKFEPISWDEALETIARRFLALRDAGEARAIANKTSGRLPRGTGSLVGRFFALLGSPNDTDVGPVCNDAGGDALAWTFGLGNFTNGYGVDGATGKEDLGSAKYFLFLGTNQAETHPVTFAHLLRCRAKTKAKLVVVDPRLTPTGEQADDWIAPKPHTDLALVLGMLHHVISKGLHDKAFVEKWVVGFDRLEKHLVEKGYSPEWAETRCGVPAAKVRQLAEEYAAAKPAAIFCNAGISHQLNAFDTYRALAFLAAITGNVGVPGGGCNFMHNTWPGDLRLPKIETKTPEKGVALPVGPDYFAESILSGKPYSLKAVVTEGNPLLGCANSKKVQDAFKKLDFYVFTGLFMEEPAYYADVILPVCSGFEIEGVYMRRDDRAIRWQDQVVARVGESRPDWEVWIDLAHATAKLDKKNPPEYWTASFPAEWKDYKKLWATFVEHTPGMKGMTRERMRERAEPLRWPCPTLDHAGVSTLYLDHASWYQAAEALDPANKGKRFLTPSGKVEVYTDEIERKLATTGHSALPTFFTHPEVSGKNETIEYTADLVPNPVNPGALTPRVKLGVLSSDELREKFPLMGMIGRPSIVHFAGVTQWTYTGKQMNGVRFIQIHPSAAKKAEIENGDPVVVESPRGRVTGTALLWDGIREDTIFVPNTFGPMQSMADDLGTPRYEAANTLIDDRYFDNLSGQQAYKCFACRVTKA